MSRHANGSSSSTCVKYKFFCTTTETPTTGERQATYGVQFAWKPTNEHIRGGGSFWKGRGPLDPDRRGLQKLAINKDNMNDDENNGDDSDIQEVTPKTNEQISIADKGFRNLFVTCNGNAVRIYEARRQRKPDLLQVFEDVDVNESFYCVAWTYNADGKHEWWVCAAGKKGVLRVINVSAAELIKSLVGHGEAINDVKIHPRDPSLVLTASKDESLRLWNLRTGATVAVFSGLKGHRGEVVHADFSIDGSKFASCGIDNSIRIWDVYADDKVVDAIKESHKIADLGVEDSYVYKDETGTRKKFKVPISQFPFFVTRKVHKHYVDCVMWVGELLLSKSVHNRMFLWQPEAERDSLASPACNYTLLDEYVLDVCNVWFIRFAIDRSRRLVACGNDKVSWHYQYHVSTGHFSKNFRIVSDCLFSSSVVAFVYVTGNGQYLQFGRSSIKDILHSSTQGQVSLQFAICSSMRLFRRRVNSNRGR